MRPSLASSVISFFLSSAIVVLTPAVMHAQSPVPVLVTQAIDESVRTQLRGNVHPMARSAFDRGAAPADLPLNRMLLVLKRSPQQEAALLRLIENQQNMQSPNYHKWLTPQQFGARFGPSDSDIAAVVNWLGMNGFQASRISNGRTVIEFSGNPLLIQQAFGTAIHRFDVNGQAHWANVSDPTVPTALAPVVAGIDSLHNFRKKAQHNLVGTYSVRTRQLTSPAPNYTFPLGTFIAYAVTPYDFAAIYNLLPLWSAPSPINGSGQVVAVVGRSDIDPSDPTTFWNLFGLDGVHAPQPTLVRTYNGPSPGINSDEIEATLDTQWAGAAAPAATVNLVISESTETTDGVDLSALYIVDNNLAPVMNVSYGQCELSLGSGGVTFYGTLWEQAAAQGISVFVATGDNGSAGCDDPDLPATNGLQVNGLASTPFNAAVGGTDFNDFNNWSPYWNATNAPVTLQSAKGYIPETTWNDSCTNSLLRLLPGGTTNPETNCNNSSFSGFLDSVAGSGGRSASWLKPAWQTGTPSDNARDIPDISLFASNGFVQSFYVICQRDLTAGCDLSSLVGIGGTSVSSPAFAGIMALVNQKTGSPQGVPGLVLYTLAAQQPSAFHDALSGSTITVPCVTGSANCTTATAGHHYGVLSGFSTATGYDLATGLGSVNAANLVNNWSSIGFNSSITSLALNSGIPVNVKHGSAVPVGINVNPAAATGSVALLVSPGTPGTFGFDTFTLSNGAINGTTTMLPGGTYSVIAHYAGDTNYGGSYSNSVPVNISAETSKTLPNLVTVDINGNPISFTASSATYGSGYAFFRVDVGDAAASVSSTTGISSTCSKGMSSCPTGNVTLSASGTPLNGISLSLNSQGYGEYQTLPPGTYSVSSSYAGDASYSSSTGSARFTINKAPTTTTAGTPDVTVQYGNSTQIAADVLTTSNGVAPTGTFQFLVDGSPVGGPVLVYESGPYNPQMTPSYAWADASTTTTFLSIGQHSLSAQYSGDGNYASSTSPQTPVTVGKAQPSFLGYGWNTFNQPVYIGQTINTTARLYGSQAGVAPTGTMSFLDNNTAFPGTVTYSPSVGMLDASIPYTFTTPGTHSLTVNYSGDSNYFSATTPVPQVITVLGPVSVDPSAAVTISSPGQSGSTTLAVTPNNGFTGAVSLSCSPDPRAKESGCSFTSGSSSGSTVQINVATAPVSVGFTVTTTAPHRIAKVGDAPLSHPAQLALAGVAVLFLPVVRRRRRVLHTMAILVLALGVGCGGGGGSSSGGGGGNTDPGTPVGTYTFTVVAVTGTGSSAISLSTPVTVVVQ
jgi:hypothetical protein